MCFRGLQLQSHLPSENRKAMRQRRFAASNCGRTCGSENDVGCKKRFGLSTASLSLSLRFARFLGRKFVHISSVTNKPAHSNVVKAEFPGLLQACFTGASPWGRMGISQSLWA